MVPEVVSPGHRGNDYFVKPHIYAQAGIPIFMRVETIGDGAPRVEVLVLVLHDGCYVQCAVACAGEIVTLDEPFACSFDPAELTGPRRTR